MYKKHNPPLPYLGVIAICYFSYLNFVGSIAQKRVINLKLHWDVDFDEAERRIVQEP